MNIPASRWYRVIEKRRSRRHFLERLPEERHLNKIQSVCNAFQPFRNVRAILIKEPPGEVFKGITIFGSYGRVRGAKAFIAFVANTGITPLYEQIGYTGEGIILEAEAMNLNTCWVGGSFRREIVNPLLDLDEDEKVIAIAPIGYAEKELTFEEKLTTAFGIMHRRKPLSDIVSGLKETEWPKWMKASLEAARLAPSAVNRQPWRFLAGENSVTVATNDRRLKIDSIISKRLCCGIAMLHIEVAALTFNVKGHWEFLNPPGVARFVVGS